MKQSATDASSERKLDFLLKKVAVLENMIVMGNNVYTKDHAKGPVQPLLRGEVITQKTEVSVGETFAAEIKIENTGKAPAVLEQIEDILPQGIGFVTVPKIYQSEYSHLDMKRKTLEAGALEKFQFSAMAHDKGIFIISPKLIYVDADGLRKSSNLNPTAIEAREIILPDRVSTGYKDLDNLLFGGLPKNSATLLKSKSCDETRLLLRRFLEKGVRENEITVYITIEASNWRTLAEESASFYVFVCNPQADSAESSRPNVIRLRGVENLTDISIPLMSNLRKIDESNEKPKRICIEILSDILLQHHAVLTRRWLVGLITELKSKGYTILAYLNPYMHPPEEVQAILDLFEGEIEISERKVLEVKKLLGQNYLESKLLLKKERLVTSGTARKQRYLSY